MSPLQLFAACVGIWGSTWLAITFQLGKVAPEASVFYRFLLASALLFSWCRLAGMRLRFGAADHGWFALQGVMMFSIGYVSVYYAEKYLVSGLVAVGYSASPLLNMILARFAFGTPVTLRVGLGAAMGIVGIALVFWPEFARLGEGGDVALGVAFTMFSVVLSALANLVAHRNHEAGLPTWQTMAWGMLYGSMTTLLLALVTGKPLDFEPTVPYVASLVYLAVFGSILAFGAFLNLLFRVGAARAGYVGVMVPIVALVFSSIFEGYRWSALGLCGVAISVAGNVIMLRK